MCFVKYDWAALSIFLEVTFCIYLFSTNDLKSLSLSMYPLDTVRKLNLHKTFKRRSGRLLNVLCTVNLRQVSKGYSLVK